MKGLTHVGHVYFIYDLHDDAIKIGFAKSVKARFGELQVATSHELFILGSMPGSTKDEHQLHKQFKCIHGEWFVATKELWTYIGEHTETTPIFRIFFLRADFTTKRTFEECLSDLHAQLGISTREIIRMAVQQMWKEDMNTISGLEFKVARLSAHIIKMKERAAQKAS